MRPSVFLVTFFACAATSIEGSTHHLASALLRIGLCWVVLWLVPRRRNSTLLCISLAIIVTLSGAGLFWSERLTSGLKAWANLTSFAVLLLAAQASARSRNKDILQGISIAAVFQSLWAVTEFVSVSGRASAGFFNPNNLGAWLLLVGTASTFQQGPFAIATGASCAVGILVSGSRSAALGLFTVIVLSLLRKSRRLAYIGAASSLGVAATLSTLRTRMLGAYDAYAFDRIHIWSAAIFAGLREPWGFGLGDTRIAFRQVGVPLLHGAVRFPKIATQAHSEWLQLWMELGWLGLVIIALCLLSGAILIGSKENEGARSKRAIGRSGAIAILSAIAIPASFGESLRVPIISMSAGLLLGIRARELDEPCLDFSCRGWLITLSAMCLLFTVPTSLGRVSAYFATTTRDQGRAQTARQWSKFALWVAPHDVANHLLDASLEYQYTHDAPTALTRLKSIALRFPSHPAPPERMIRVLRHLPISAERDFLLLELARWRAEVEPNHALRWFELSRAAQAVGEQAEQQSALEQALELEPNCARALVDMMEFTDTAEMKQRFAIRALRAHKHSTRYQGFVSAVLRLPPELEARARSTLPIDFQIPPNPLDLSPL